MVASAYTSACVFIHCTHTKRASRRRSLPHCYNHPVVYLTIRVFRPVYDRGGQSLDPGDCSGTNSYAPTASGTLFSSKPYFSLHDSTRATYCSCASSGVTPSSTLVCQAFFLALPYKDDARQRSALLATDDGSRE